MGRPKKTPVGQAIGALSKPPARQCAVFSAPPATPTTTRQDLYVCSDEVHCDLILDGTTRLVPEPSCFGFTALQAIFAGGEPWRLKSATPTVQNLLYLAAPAAGD